MLDVKEVLKKLVSFNTIADKENKEFLDYVQSILEDMGFILEKREKYLIMSYGKDAKVGFIGHSDTVNYIEGWNTDPFVLTEKDDNLYGLGSSDMKSGIAAIICAVSQLDINKMKNGIKIYITYDEEIGFKGIYDVVAYEKDFPEYVLVGEPTNNESLTSCKGLLEVSFESYGIKVHSSRTDKGENANLLMIKFLNELNDFYEKEIKIVLDKTFEVPYTTMNIGLINGGSGINSVSDNCRAYCDFRILKNEQIGKIKEKIMELSKKYKVNYKFEYEIKPFSNYIDFLENQGASNFMTEASFVNKKRIILGAGPVTAHEINEYISVDSLNKLVGQYKEIIKKCCF